MPCVTPTGELTPSGRSILEVLVQPRDVQWIADATGLPVFRTRAAASSCVRGGGTMTGWPGCQLAGVATWCVSAIWRASITRRISGIERPVVSG